MMRATSAACIACPARSAITWPSSGLPSKRQVADQIQRFVAAALVREAQSAGIHDAVAAEAHRVIELAPRIKPMLRIWSSSHAKPNVRAGAISVA